MKVIIVQFFLFFTIISGLQAEKIELIKTSILVSPNIKSPVRETLVKILKEEVGKRTSLDWQQTKKWEGKNSAIIAIALSQDRYCGVSALLKKAIPVDFEVRYM